MGLNNQDNCKILAKYFEDLLNCKEPSQKLKKRIDNAQVPKSKPPTADEIEGIIKSLKNDKSPGADSITAECFKNDSKRMAEIFEKIFEQIWLREEIPVDWKEALLHPLHKKGSKSNTNNYRGISLLPTAYKILSGGC